MFSRLSFTFFAGPQCCAISALGQQSLGKVEAFLKLRKLSRLISQTVLGVLERCSVLLQSLAEVGNLGSRGSAPA